MLVLVLARMDVSAGDIVRYLPNFDDPYRKELASVRRIIPAKRENQFNSGPAATPYWLEVTFMKDGAVSVLNARSFILEETRQSISQR